jgi:hypothetical protein
MGYRESSSLPTWSISRDQQLHACERKYFFQYLAGGRISGGTQRQGQIGLMKKLKAVPLWLGDCFHAAVAGYLSILRDGGVPVRAEFLRSVRLRIDRDWNFSAQGRYRTQPFLIDKAGVALLEHYYGQMPADMNAERAYFQVEGPLNHFIDWAEGRNLAAEVQGADRLWIEPPAWGIEAPGFQSDGIQVITKVDFAWERAGEAFVIYDWKLGNPPRTRQPFLSQHELQVGVYMLWPHLAFNLDLARIQGRVVYCGGAAVVEEHQLDPETLPLVLATLKDSIRLTQQWTKRHEAGQTAASTLNFAANVATCRLCGFRELCRSDMLN